MPTSRSRRRAFALIEPFVIAPIMLVVGLAITFAIRWLLSTDHWTTWIPTVILGIPFLIFDCILLPRIFLEPFFKTSKSDLDN